MATVSIDELLLDVHNPRSAKAKSQKDAIRKVLEEQRDKLVKLAESIIDRKGLSPLDRILVLAKKSGEVGYVVLEGNRRVAALKVLANPSLLDDAKISKGVRDRLDHLSTKFKKSAVEPVEVAVVKKRSDAKYWINLRHTGANGGAGVVQWATTQQERFQGPSPQLEILEFVRAFGKLSDYEATKLEGRFITTLRRLIDSPDVRSIIGIEKSGQSLFSKFPAIEIMKPLKRIVLDLSLKHVKVDKLKTVEQMVAYVNSFSPNERPNPVTAIAPRAITSFTAQDFIPPPTPAPSPTPSPPTPPSPPAPPAPPTPPKRTGIVPTGHSLNVKQPRIRAIQDELIKLKYSQHMNAIAVLFRVFFETSIDHYLISINSSGKKSNGKFKSLVEKTTEAIDDLILKGADQKTFNPLKAALSSPASPLWIDLLHSYIHNPSGTPTEHSLNAAWDHATPLLKAIWP